MSKNRFHLQLFCSGQGIYFVNLRTELPSNSKVSVRVSKGVGLLFFIGTNHSVFEVIVQGDSSHSVTLLETGPHVYSLQTIISTNVRLSQ